MKRQLRHLRQPTQVKGRDEGSTLILCLVVIIIGAFFVLPMMTYIMTVNQASRLRIESANSSEVVRGGLRSVLYDPAALYQACANSGASDASAGTSPRIGGPPPTSAGSESGSLTRATTLSSGNVGT